MPHRSPTVSDANCRLPTVTWGGHHISRLVIGHNPFKGHSHFSEELDAEMKAWHDREHSLATLRRAEECGVNTAQFGAEIMHALLREHKRQGGTIQWIATLYSGVHTDADFDDELRGLLAMDPRPIGIQHYGGSTDTFYLDGRFDLARERVKRLRDTGLLIGLCTHLPEVVEETAAEGWDLDFYQTSFYTCYSGAMKRGLGPTEKIFDDADRDRMARVVGQVDTPCLAFKVLGASRKCGSDDEVRAALRFAFDHIKPTDAVCVGMWQKHTDQVAQDAALVRQILAG